jgi:hypothetical protein
MTEKHVLAPLIVLVFRFHSARLPLQERLARTPQTTFHP